MKKIRVLAIMLCIALLLPTLTACKKVRSEKYFEYFDTVSVIQSYARDSKKEFEANCKAVSDLLSDYHRLFDIYFEYSGINNLKTVNMNAGKEPVKVDERLIDFLIYARKMYTLTNGQMNIAFGAVTRLWHDARESALLNPESAKVPSGLELEKASYHTNINKIIIDKEASTVFISDPDMSIDVGALGKGYATERAAELLISRGVSSYVLNIGGNIRAIGEKPSGDGWVTGITNPDKSSDEPFITKVIIKDLSLVTSGDYERFYTVGGIRYHHIIDPDTCKPARHFSSVSVFNANSALSDALSTALFCMSYEEGLGLIKSLGNTDAIWVFPDGMVKMTDGIVISE
ncbi:MAG: FAD:protein FMN transferase [Clostridia bacterium]|nr:FAD:protein FMN transferase [Clostridia bacterium]